MEKVFRWLAATIVVILAVADLTADTLELRGTGVLPGAGEPVVGVPGEDITVSVMLKSDDFQYVPLSNPIIHYFAPNTVIPVNISGSISGAYSEVSPIARFVALELENSPSAGDSLMLDVTAGTSGTSLLNLSTTGISGFDGNVTPKNTDDLFTLFSDAMDDLGFWTPSSSSAVFVGPDADLLFLGQLQWTLVNPDAGDMDADGDVDGRDFLLWQRAPEVGPLSGWQANYGTVATETHGQDSGDFNLDGIVDGRDFLAWQRDPSAGDLADWQANYEDLLQSVETLSVPEPAPALILIICCCTAVVLRRFPYS